MIERIAAIVRADVLVRFRRFSTLVVFLLLSSTVFWWVPNPSTGKTLMQIAERRVLYNSAAIGMGTAMLATIFVGMFGFYVVSNAVRRDIASRCGFVAASTRMRTHEYLLGKFLGNVVFLTTFMGGFMLAAMVMLVIRAEAPLQPLVFARQYAILLPSTIVFVSVIAILFESIPWLSGRFGDVVYFFFWAGTLGVVVNAMEHGAASWVRFFDFNSFGYLLEYSKATWHTKSFSIGQSSFDMTKPPLVIDGLRLTGDWLIVRIVSTLLPLPLLGVALLFFHRFDPARVRAAGAKGKRSWLAAFNRLSKPLVRPLVALAMRPGAKPSLLRAAASDASLTIASLPLIGVALIGIAIATLAGANVLIAGFFFIGVFIADIATRARSAGTLGLVYSAPLLQSKYVAWKLIATLIVAVAIMGFPLVRTAITNPIAALSMIVAIFFVCAAATALGVISGNPKTFIVTYLALWYVSVSDKGSTPAINYAGFMRVPPATVMAGYFAVAIALLVAAEGMHRRILRRT
jgi:hypothetical protein